eukprot:2649719-Alexandrium_andersonii.AAC.1
MSKRICSAAYSARSSAQASAGSCRSRCGGQSPRRRVSEAGRATMQAWSDRSRCQLAVASKPLAALPLAKN